MRQFLVLSLFFGIAIPGAARETVLVVPFSNASGEASLDWIGESVAESMTDALAAFDIPVVSPEDREAAAHRLAIRSSGQLTTASILKLAQHCNAAKVVHGRFEWRRGESSGGSPGGKLTLRAEAIALGDLRREARWAVSGDLSDLSELQTKLAWEALKRFARGPVPPQQEYLKEWPAVRIDAMENYVRGLLATGSETRHRYFARAVDLEPGFSPACFQLGLMQWEESNYSAADQWMKRVAPTDAHYLEANFIRGLCRYYTGNYAGAEESFALVARSVSTANVFNDLGLAEFRLGRAGAIENLRWAIGRRPRDPDLHFNAGYVLWRQGDLDSAAVEFRKVLEIDSRDADARRLLERCTQGNGPRRGDLSAEGLERLEEDLGTGNAPRPGPTTPERTGYNRETDAGSLRVYGSRLCSSE